MRNPQPPNIAISRRKVQLFVPGPVGEHSFQALAYETLFAGSFHAKSVSMMGCGKTTMSGDKNFDRKTPEYPLAELGRRAFAAGRTVEIVIYGGSALLLALNRQINTGDVDAVFGGNKDFLKRLAAEMAAEV